MDEYETRYQTKMDTISKMTALKNLIGPKAIGDKFTGAQYTQDEMGIQEMRKQFHKYLLDSQSPNGPAPMDLNAIMSNRGAHR